MKEDGVHGSIKSGKRADHIINDTKFNVKSAFILGKMCYNKES